MIKELKLDYFLDGIKHDDVSCVDIPTAVACGYYNNDYYFFYLLLSLIDLNWQENKLREDNILKDNIFEILGLRCESINISDKKYLFNMLKLQIDNNHPVILTVSDYDIFYSNLYKKSHHIHCMLINGYNTGNNIIYLRETLRSITTSISDVNSNSINGMYPFRIKIEMLMDIWEMSEQTEIYVLKQIKSPQVTNYNDIFLFFIINYNILKSKFINDVIVQNIDSNIDMLRFNYLKGMNAFFYIIERYISIKNIDKHIRYKFKSFKDEYLELRNVLISKLHKNLLKKRDIDIDNIITKTNEMDKRLVVILNEIILGDFSKESIIEYARKSKITASSEYDDNMCNASNVILNDDVSYWRSGNAYPHWLMFELPNSINIKKIIIKHDFNMRKLTQDFKIQASDNKKDWTDLCQIKDNSKVITTHEFISVKCKYIRLYITLPSIEGPYARIKNVQIYGID